MSCTGRGPEKMPHPRHVDGRDEEFHEVLYCSARAFVFLKSETEPQTNRAPTIAKTVSA